MNRLNGGRGPWNYEGRNHVDRDRYVVNHEEERGPRYEDPSKSIKHTLPKFHGKYDPTMCLEWLSHVERIFDLHHYAEDDKMKFVVAKFWGYAHVWWSDIVRRRRTLVGGEVEDWVTPKALMETNLEPKSYFIKLRAELTYLKQGAKKVMDYLHNLLILKNKLGIDESENATQGRFIHGFNMHLRHKVQLEAFEGNQTE